MNRSTISPVEARQQFRAGLIQPTSGWSAGFAQANLISMPQDLAYDFLLFAQRNPKPCPILEVLNAGETFGGIFGSNATEADIRTDAPQYRIYEHGELIDSPPAPSIIGATTSSVSSSAAPLLLNIPWSKQAFPSATSRPAATSPCMKPHSLADQPVPYQETSWCHCA